MTVAFIGHRRIPKDESFAELIRDCIEYLIVNEKADKFIFGDMTGRFNNLCCKIVHELKEKYPQIERIDICVSSYYIGNDFGGKIDAVIEPSSVAKATTLKLIKRNEAMIDMCDLFMLYGTRPPAFSGFGTSIALQYALLHKKPVLNIASILSEEKEYINIEAVKKIMTSKNLSVENVCSLLPEFAEQFEQCYSGKSQCDKNVRFLFSLAKALDVSVGKILLQSKPAKRPPKVTAEQLKEFKKELYERNIQIRKEIEELIEKRKNTPEK